jgi:hypothetical protein
MSTTQQVQHTPGPWAYQATAGNHDFAIYPEATGRDLALVRDFNEANARLIAAAPDLLAALRALLAVYDVELGGIGHREAREARALLTRIAGEA